MCCDIPKLSSFKMCIYSSCVDFCDKENCANGKCTCQTTSSFVMLKCQKCLMNGHIENQMKSGTNRMTNKCALLFFIYKDCKSACKTIWRKYYKYLKHDSQYLKVGNFDLYTTQRQTNFTQICHHTVQIKCH